MAASVTSAWSKPGAWALDSEQNEDELLKQHKQNAINDVVSAIPESDFPSLGAVAKTKTKKKKPQTLSLHEFTTSSAAGKQSFNTGLTPDELLMLPTAPKERTAEELSRGGLGGGFRSYDTSRGSRGSDDSRRGGFSRDDNREPSRADETDNWGAAKKALGGGGFDRRERGERGGFFSDSQSRADDVANWGAGKKSPVGGGFDRRERGERGGFFSDSQSRADDVDNWGANKSFVASDGRRNERRGVGFESNGGADSENWLKKKEQDGQKFGGSFDSLRSRRGTNESMSSPESDVWGRKKEEINGNGNGVVARPRLNLQPRTKPLGDGQQKGNGDVDVDVVKPKGSNPFGEARPREEVLKEKGQDWKEVDEKLEADKIKDIKEAVNPPPDAKKGFGFSNGRGSSTENAWRKPLILDPRPSSSETRENGHAEEPQVGEAQA